MRGSSRFAGRIALITGASRGIGAALATRLGTEGAHCILCARTVKGLEETDDAIRAAGGQASLVPIDLREAAKVENLAFTLAKRFGRIDILIGNAARLGRISPVAHIDSHDWLETLALNVTANRELIRIFETLLRASHAARVVFVTSGAARGKAYFGAYSASKAALEAMVKAWAKEITQTRIRVNLVDPGRVRTAMRAQAFPGEDKRRLVSPEQVASAMVPLLLVSCQSHGQLLRL